MANPPPCSHPVVSYQPLAQGARKAPACCSTLAGIAHWVVTQNINIFGYGACYVFKKILGSDSISVHASGRAYDIMVKQPYRGGGNADVSFSSRQALMTSLIDNYLMPAACELGIQRMIWNTRWWNSGEATLPHSSWRKIDNSQPNKHTDHLHIELTPSLCNKYSSQGVTSVLAKYGKPSQVVTTPLPTGTITDPPTVTGGPTTNNGTTGNTGAGSVGAGGGDVQPIPTTTNTNPVWSVSNPIYSPCSVCGGTFASLTTDPNDGTVNGFQTTFCGGTGAICINTTTGETCSTGAAPQLGNFPGGIRDFLWWGDGAYGLSADGQRVDALGTATAASFSGDPTPSGGWTSLYAINPTTIGVSRAASSGPIKSARATVSSLAKYTCC